MEFKTSEPLVAVIFKALAVLSLVSAVVYLWKGMFGGSTSAGFGMEAAEAVRHANYILWGIMSAGSALTLWWMGAILAYVARIADATEARTVAPAPTRPEPKVVAPAKATAAPSKIMRVNTIDPAGGEVPSYKI